MPRFTSDPPEDDRGTSLPITRTPVHKPITGVVTSENMIGCPTHFHKGRTIPCEPPECPACNEGSPTRWHGYVAAYNPSTGMQFLYEFTRKAAEAFVDYRREHKTLRGCQFQARRHSPRPNGQVIILTKPFDLTHGRLPKAPDLIKCLSILWNLPTPAVDSSVTNTIRCLRTPDDDQKRA